MGGCSGNDTHTHTHSLSSVNILSTPDLSIGNNSIMCRGGNSTSSFQMAHKDGTLRNVQNPIYGDTTHDENVGRPPQVEEHLYDIATIGKTPQPALLVSDSVDPAVVDEAPGKTEPGQSRCDYAVNGATPERTVNDKESQEVVISGDETSSST